MHSKTMTHSKTMALGLALVAILVLGAAGAPAASAQQSMLTTETGEPVTLAGSEIGKVTPITTAFGSSTQCPESSGTGHKLDSTPHELILNESTTFTMTVHVNQENCFAKMGEGEFPVTIMTNGCDAVLQLEEEVSEGTFTGSTELVCPEGEVYESIIYSDSEHTQTLCVLKVAPQVVTGSAEVTNAAGDLEVGGTATGIHVTRSGLCLLDGKGSTTNEGELHFDATITAHDELSEPVGVTISD